MDRGKILVLKLKGRFLDASNKDHFLELARAKLTLGQDVVLNLSGLDFIDSIGMGGLLALYKTLKESGCQLALALPTMPVQQAFSLVYMHHKIPLFSTLKEAVSSLASTTDIDQSRQTANSQPAQDIEELFETEYLEEP